MCRMTFPNIIEEMKTLRSERGTDSPGTETGGRAKAGKPGSSEHGCQPQGSCLQGNPQPGEAHLNQDTTRRLDGALPAGQGKALGFPWPSGF